MVKLCESEIQGIPFSVWISCANNLKVSKVEINGDSAFVQDVDLAQIIRAVMTSETVLDFEMGIKGVWTEDQIKGVLKEHF